MAALDRAMPELLGMGRYYTAIKKPVNLFCKNILDKRNPRHDYYKTAYNSI
jgi:hypothetical protein